MTVRADDARPSATHKMASFAFPAEHELILCCARVKLPDDLRQRLRELARSDLDWEQVLAETLRQSMVPLVYRHLVEHCAENVPPDTLAAFRRHSVLASARSLAMAAELRAITALLEEGGVRPLPYKGPVLALQAYGDIALRTFTDLDILVRPDELAKARGLLERRGYAPLEQWSRSQEKAILRFEHNLPLLREEGRIVLELHWRIAPVALTFRLPVDRLWEHARPIDLGGVAVRGMAPADLILVLAVHGTRHAWSAVEWIAGIAELIRQPDDHDWDTLARDAERFGVGRAVRLALALTDALLDAPLPDSARRWIATDARIPLLVDWVARHLFEPIDNADPAQQLAAFRFEMLVKDTMGARALDILCRVLLPTEKDWAAIRLPDPLYPLYFLVRPVRLLGRALSAGSRIVKRK